MVGPPKARLHLSYAAKITLVSLLLIMVPFVMTSLSAGQRFFEYLEQKSVDSADQIIRNLNRYLEQFFSEVNNLTILPLYDHEVVQVLKNHSLGGSKYVTSDEYRRITSYLTSLRYSKNEMEVLFFTMDGNILGTGEMGYKMQWKEKTRWMELADQNPTSSLIIPYDPQDDYYPNAQKTDGYLTVSRYLQEPLYKTPIGYIHFIIQPDYMNEFLDTVNFTKGSLLTIYNSFGQQVYPIGEALGPVTARDGDMVELNGIEYIVSSVTSSSTQLRFVALISLDDLRRDMLMLMSQVIVTVCVALGVSMVFAILASLRIAKPIVRLKNKMLLVGQGHFDTRSPVGSNDEIGQLQRMFNDMAENLERMINEVYEASLAEKDAQIAALQAQINPHFLYNTLETINMMAVNAERYDISMAVSSLGRMMRYCVDNESFFVSLSEEAAFITTYFDILKLRHEDMRSIAMDFAPGDLRAEVPKLILQPFVENVAKHALEDGPVDVRLSSRCHDGYLDLIVENNGKALTQEEVASLNEKLASGSREKRAGYGISNVHRRLRLIYGPDCGVTVDSGQQGGARFILRIQAKGPDRKEEHKQCQA